MKGALVTGAGLRIGRALAMALAADGFFVFVHYNRSAAEARRTVAAIAAAGGKAKAVRPICPRRDRPRRWSANAAPAACGSLAW